MHWRMLAGVTIGAALGAAVHATLPDHPVSEAAVAWVARPIGQIFLRLLFMVVLPLVFSALALGVAELGRGDRSLFARVGGWTLAYSVAMSAIAVGLGVALVEVLRPGEGLDPSVREQLLSGAGDRAAFLTTAPPPKTGVDLLIRIIPDNLVRAGADNDMIAVMFAAVLVGVGLASVRTPEVERVHAVLQGVFDLSVWVVSMVMRIAPLGVGALMFALTADVGAQVLVQLAWFVGTVLLGLGIHQFLVIPAAVWLLGDMSPVRFFRGIQGAMLTAFSTASSSATLPTTLRVADEMGLPARISRFVLTVGATANQNGTALFEGVTVLFLAQFYGVALTIPEQLLVASVCVLGGIGTAGVPAGSLPVVALILGMIGVPVEGIGLVLGVDRLLDMARTTLNVSGDLGAAVIISNRAS